MKQIRAGAGIGDSIYLRPIAEWFQRNGTPVRALSEYPDVFRGSEVEVGRFERVRSAPHVIIAHYAGGKASTTTTQFEDMCKSAGITKSVPMRFAWEARNHKLLNELRIQAAHRPIILVHGGRAPMGRIDGYGAELMPERGGFEVALAALDDCFLIRVGKGAQLYPLNVDCDLNGKTTVGDILDIASICHGVVAQCSFAVPLAEVFDRPLLGIWSARGLASKDKFISAITPHKIYQGARSRHVIDNWDPSRIQEVARASLRFVG